MTTPPAISGNRPRVSNNTQTQETQNRPQTQTPAPANRPAAPEAPKDSWDGPIQQVGNAANGVKSITDIVGGTQTRTVNGAATIGGVEIPRTTTHAEGVNTRAGRIAGAAGTLAGAAQLPGAAYTAQRDIRAAIANPNGDTIRQATNSTASAASTTASVAKGVLENGAAIQTARQTQQAATAAFRTVAPEASEAVVRSATRAASQSALEGAAVGTARRAAVAAGRTAITETGETVARAMGTAGRAAGRTALREGGEAAARAAVGAAAHGAGGALARGAARFAPGLNVAIAAADTAVAATTLMDPNASTTKKVTSVITAAGSIAAATNIPVVSQVGAAVSTISSLVGGIWG